MSERIFEEVYANAQLNEMKRPEGWEPAEQRKKYVLNHCSRCGQEGAPVVHVRPKHFSDYRICIACLEEYYAQYPNRAQHILFDAE